MTTKTPPKNIRACGNCGKHRIALDRYCSRCGVIPVSRLTEWQAKVRERVFLKHQECQDLEKARRQNLTPKEREEEDQQLQEDIALLFPPRAI